MDLDIPYSIIRKRPSMEGQPDISCAISNFTITQKVCVRFKIYGKSDEMWIGLCTDSNQLN